MSFEKDIILKFNQYLKSVKMPYIIYADIKPLIKKNGSANNPENSSAQKEVSIFFVDIQFQQFWHMIIWKTTILLYHGDDCMERFFESLSEHTKNILDFEKKRILPLTKRN